MSSPLAELRFYLVISEEDAGQRLTEIIATHEPYQNFATARCNAPQDKPYKIWRVQMNECLEDDRL